MEQLGQKQEENEIGKGKERKTPLDLLDVREFLLMKETNYSPHIIGGSLDALVVHASKSNEKDIQFQEAFLNTYRSFVNPPELVSKLLYRYHRFTKCTSDLDKQKASRNVFALLVRVVEDLTVSDLTKELLQTLMDFVYELICSGDLLPARALRNKIVEKTEIMKKYLAPRRFLTTLGVSTTQATLLDFKAFEIAEQITLLDAELFSIIQIPEALIWSWKQSEEKSPYVTAFINHFNKMSIWARSQILKLEDAHEREKYVMKFIKILKHLRQMNNFSSYLVILSALETAAVRRLEWPQHIMDSLKEYGELFDPSVNFKTYRQTLAESTPPCIPHIGLILQDLTFIHIGNPNLNKDKSINFQKRWQFFNILDDIKKYIKCSIQYIDFSTREWSATNLPPHHLRQYQFKKNEKILEFFNNFDDHLQTDALWDISLDLKPRK